MFRVSGDSVVNRDLTRNRDPICRESVDGVVVFSFLPGAPSYDKFAKKSACHNKVTEEDIETT